MCCRPGAAGSVNRWTSRPGSTANCAPGMCSARYRPWSSGDGRIALAVQHQGRNSHRRQGAYAHPSASARRRSCSHLSGCTPVGSSGAPSGRRPGHEPRRERRTRPWLASPTLARRTLGPPLGRASGVPRGELRECPHGERRGSVDEDQPSRAVRDDWPRTGSRSGRHPTIRVAPPAPTRPHPARPARHRPTVPNSAAAPPRRCPRTQNRGGRT